MRKRRVLMVVGARPQFIKSAPIIKEILSKHKSIDLQVIHSGQHYDPQMSSIFFHELQIPKPALNLRVGSGSHGTQTAKIMLRLERHLVKAKPDTVVVPGDTNTTLAGALVAAKLGIPVSHVEAGLRSNDMLMPEEVNRRLTDHCSSLLFAPTRNAASNLRSEGFGGGVYLTGDTMIDALHAAIPSVNSIQKLILDRLNAVPREFVLVTLHRPSNVDNQHRLRQIIDSLRRIAGQTQVIFPVHPRTKIMLSRLGILKRSKKSGLSLIPPQGYLESLALLRNAECLVTDSGGMQKESFFFRVPCITLRQSTEWPETLGRKANRLVADPRRIPDTVRSIASDGGLRRRLRGLGNPFGDGRAAARIAKLLTDAALEV